MSATASDVLSPVNYFKTLVGAIANGECLPVPPEPACESSIVDAHLRSLRLFKARHYEHKSLQTLADDEGVTPKKIQQWIDPIEDMVVKKANALMKERMYELKYFNLGSDGLNYLRPSDVAKDGTVQVVLTFFNQTDPNGFELPVPSSSFKYWLESFINRTPLFGEYDPAGIMAKPICQSDLTRTVNYTRAAFQIINVSFVAVGAGDTRLVKDAGLCATIYPNGPMAHEVKQRINSGKPLIFRMRVLERKGPPVHDEDYDVVTWDLVN